MVVLVEAKINYSLEVCVILRESHISLLYNYYREQLIDNYDCNLVQSCRQLLHASVFSLLSPVK